MSLLIRRLQSHLITRNVDQNLTLLTFGYHMVPPFSHSSFLQWSSSFVSSLFPLSSSRFLCPFVLQPFTNPLLDFSRQPDNLDDIIAIAIEAEFPPDRSKLPNDRSLNDRESNRMMELFLASRALEEPLEVLPEILLPDLLQFLPASLIPTGPSI